MHCTFSIMLANYMCMELITFKDTGLCLPIQVKKKPHINSNPLYQSMSSYEKNLVRKLI